VILQVKELANQKTNVKELMAIPGRYPNVMVQGIAYSILPAGTTLELALGDTPAKETIVAVLLIV